MMQSYEQMLSARIKTAYPEFLENCALGIGLGWYPLMLSLITSLSQISRGTSAKFEATCVKEKFGGLRVYFNGCGGGADVQEIANLLVDLAEHLSFGVCEVCGEAGSLNYDKRWLRARCPVHEGDNGYLITPEIVEGLVSAALPKMDLSRLPRVGRIERPEKSRLDGASRLTMITYRSLDDYSQANLTDIEMHELVGWFINAQHAAETAREMGCRMIQHRSIDGLKAPI